MTTPINHQVTYAVGDIHGRLDLLEQAVDAIESHARGLASRIVFLGDYIDRGPDSRGVLERLMGLQRDTGAVCLKGNHEDLMIRAFTSFRPSEFTRWRQCGGGATLASYGIGDDEGPAGAMPRDHIRWLAGLPLTTADPSRIYVHAGVAPNRSFRDQDEATLMWIREAFLRGRAKDFDTHIVHGHTPLWEGKPDPAKPERLSHRTNLDTAAFATGVLSVGVFERLSPGGPDEIISVRGAAIPHPLADIVGPTLPAHLGKRSDRSR